MSRPLPKPSAMTQPFWEAARRHQLLVPQCQECGARFFAPEPVCPSCFASGWRWVASPGEGTVYSFSVVHRTPGPGFEVPFVLAIIDLDDGWSLMTHVVGCSPEAVSIGMRVRVAFHDTSEEISLPVFEPTDE